MSELEVMLGRQRRVIIYRPVDDSLKDSFIASLISH